MKRGYEKITKIKTSVITLIQLVLQLINLSSALEWLAMALRQIVRRLVSSRLNGHVRYNSSKGRQWLRIVIHIKQLCKACIHVSFDAVCGDNAT